MRSFAWAIRLLERGQADFRRREFNAKLLCVKAANRFLTWMTSSPVTLIIWEFTASSPKSSRTDMDSSSGLEKYLELSLTKFTGVDETLLTQTCLLVPDVKGNSSWVCLQQLHHLPYNSGPLATLPGFMDCSISNLGPDTMGVEDSLDCVVCTGLPRKKSS